MDRGTNPSSVVLFDGVCNMCNASVNFIIDRDPDSHFRFAALQSPQGAAVLSTLGAPELGQSLSSVLLVEDGKLYKSSSAALRIAARLRGPSRLLTIFRFVPRPLRDLVYGWIAKNRYRWFGQRESCRMPTPELRARFL